MIPLRDENPSRSFPFVTLLLIGANVAVFLYELSLSPRALERFVLGYGAIPAAILSGDRVLPDGSFVPWMTLLTSMFLHGGIMHLVGNMLYLWIFGDNVEDVVGHIPYIFFYLLCGVAAAFAHIMLAPNSQVPTLGASGAIAGVLGAYLVMFPNNRVLAMVPAGRTMVVREVSALMILGFWFVLQAINMIMGWAAPDQGGVAFAAHVGGFIAGAALGLLWKSMFGAPVTRAMHPA